MKKKLFALVLAGLMAAGLTACQGKAADDSAKSSSEAESAVSSASAAAASVSSSASSVSAPAGLEDGVFTVGFDAEYPPYGYMDDNGEYTGFDLELAEAVCALEGWTLEKKPINWDSKDMELGSDSIDCIWSGFTINGREDDYAWTIPYVDNSQVFVVASESGIKTFDDLKGKVVGVQAASAALDCLNGEYPDLTASFASLNEFADYNTAFTELKAGALDALAIDVGVANYQINSRGEGFEILEEVLAAEQYGIGCKKGNTALADAISAALLELTADGTVGKLAEKYEIADMVILKAE